MESIKKNKNLIWIFLLASSFALGLFNELAAVLAGAVMSIWLLIITGREKGFRIKTDMAFTAIGLIAAGYFATVLWSVDKFYSLLGFAKFLPLLIFCLLMFQLERVKREEIFSFVPISGAVMAVISFIFTQLGVCRDYFSVDGRISGFLQYPNTFALFLIIGIIVIACKKELSVIDYLLTAVLLAGIFLTGSRSSFIILVAVMIAVFFTGESKRFKLMLAGMLAAAVAAAIIYVTVSGKYGAFGRFLTISASSGTFLGRLLYFKDAVRVILHHPFGLGYMGYYFSQGSFQTGVYSNQYVHNELLQLMLDIGWIPAVLFAACVVKSIFSKNTTKLQKLILCTVAVHSMLDFDMQFLVIDFIILLCLDFGGKEKFIRIKSGVRFAVGAVTALVLCGSIYVSSSAFCYVLSDSQLAVRICPMNTLAQIDMLQASEEAEDKNAVADKILKNDKYISNAYSAKALYYYADGDIENMAENKKAAISCNRYFIDEYIDYFTIMFQVMNYYIEAGDYDSYQYCCDNIKEVSDLLDRTREETNKIAYKLQDKPELDLPEEYQEAIESIVSEY